MNRRAFACFALLLLALWPPAARAASPEGLTVLAAASLTDVLPKVATAWKASGGGDVAFSFDASSRLAKQVEAGVPADAFFSADREWMDYLEQRGLLTPGTRGDLLGNALVLVVPSGAAWVPKSAADLASPSLEHLALAGENVPAGRYARAALQSQGAWDAVKDRVVSGDNVRTTLAWVAKGEAEAGTVYTTDARVEPRVKVAFTFPETSHPPIVYPAAALKSSAHPKAAAAFLTFCRGKEARALFEAAGFTVLPQR